MSKVDDLWDPWAYLSPLQVAEKQSMEKEAGPEVCGTSGFLHRHLQISIYTYIYTMVELDGLKVYANLNNSMILYACVFVSKNLCVCACPAYIS